MRERFAAPQYQGRSYAAEQRVVYEAARSALKKMNYTFERGGPAQGVIHAFGPLDASAGGGPGTARQVVFDARIVPDIGSGTGLRLEVLFSRTVEDDFNKRPGQAMVTPLHESSLYEVFFSYVDEALKAHP